MIAYLSILIYLAKSQLQVNPISGERFFYGGRELNQFGQGLNISSPDLGFQVQGGLIQGPLNTKINTSTTLSVSLLEQYNTLAVLESGNTQYQISLIQYQYNGTTDQQQILFNISSDSVVCQYIKIIDYMTIIVHCINTTNNNVILYNYNQSQTIVTQTQIFVNQSQLINVEIQQYDYIEYYNIYFIYIMQYQSQVYYCNLENNTYSQYEQIWSYNAQFLQIQITQFQEIFALQFNYLFYQYQSYQTAYAYQNNSNWLNMLVLELTQNVLIYLINNYTLNVLAFESQFIPIQQVMFPFSIQDGQIYSNFVYTYVTTNQSVFTYTFQEQGKDLELYQYNQYVLPNLTLYNRQQNILININNNGIQLYQLLDYYIYNNKPTQSGNITLNYYNQITQQITSSFYIYINIQKTFNNQICPNVYNFNGLQYILPGTNQFYTGLSYFEGYNMSYYNSMQGYDGLYQVIQTNNIFNNTIGTSLAVYSLTNYNSLLVVFQDNSKIVFEVYQYQDEAYSSVGQSTYTEGQDLINEFEFIEYPNGTLLVLAFQVTQIVVFQYEPFWQPIYKYTVNMTNYMSDKEINLNHFFSIDGTAFFASVSYYYIIGFGVDNYTFYQNGTYLYNYVSYLKFDRNYVFAQESNEVTTFIWQDEQLIPLNTWQVPGVNSAQLNLYVFPLVNGTYVLYGTDKDMTLVFYDKSMFKTANIGNVFNMSVNVTGYSFNFNYLYYFYSSNFFYIVVQYDGLIYLNIYQCTQSPLNALYKSIWLEANPTSSSVTTNSILGVDYVALYIKSTVQIFQIPHNVELVILPQFQILSSYNFNNQIIINNSYSQTSFNMSFSVEQPFLQVSSQNLFINISNNITNDSFVINPYYFFTGAIEGYQVSCQECQEISINQLISEQSLQFDQGTQYSLAYFQDGLEYLYIADNKFLIQYIYNQSQQYNLSTQNSSGQTLVNYPIASSQFIECIFLEIYTNSISWVSLNKSTAYVNSILYGTNQTVSIQIQNITTDIQFACYQEGVIQITTQNYYFSYFYYIQNQSQYLITIIENLQISPSAYMQITPVWTFQNESNVIYGIFYQTVAYTVQLLLLDVTVDKIPIVNGINDMPLLELLKFQQLSPIQSIQQVGSPVWDMYYQSIQVAYTTSIQSGSLFLLFDRLRFLYIQEPCQFQLLNSSYQQSFTNLFASNGALMAIFNIQQGKGIFQLLLSLYYNSEESCVDGQTIQPYSYLILESSSSFLFQLSFLNSHQLLLSYNDSTYIYEVNQYLQINYVTDVNSTIVLNAFNSISSSNQSIVVQFAPPNNTTPNNTTPNNTTPNNTTPNNTTPNNTTPNNTTPNNTTPNNTTPNNTTPNNTTPNNTTPNNTTPNNTEPNNDDNKSTHLQWYWILLITIGTLFIVVIIIVGIYFKFYRNESEDGKYKYHNENEIEIKASSGLKLNQ